MRGLRRVELDYSRWIRRTQTELCRRLPSLLQSEYVARWVRYWVAGILHYGRAGV